jgi:uncharacterized protein YgiM (DUF1202 family)
MKKSFLFILLLLFFSLTQFAFGTELSENNTPESVTKNIPTCTVSGCRTTTINLRSGPGVGYRKAGKLYQGYTLEILGKKRNWYQVKIVDPPEGTIGWVRQDLVTLD